MKKIALFGAGLYGKKFLEKNDDIKKNNFLFCDNDINKQGMKIRGLEVISFHQLENLYREGIVGKIIVTTVHIEDVLEKCIENEINKKDIYFYDITTNTVKTINEIHTVAIFSQDGEEVFLREFFGNKKIGFYVDVGAYHPFRFSNTAWAYEKGWNGINIEPNIEGYKKFIRFRERDINLNCGISDKECRLPYYEFDEGAYNTFSQENILVDRKVRRISQLPMRRLDSIFSEYHVKMIDFLDIDVEGNELNVLYSNNWNLYRPTIVLCEQIIGMEDIIYSDIYSFMKQNGYDAISKYNRTVIYKESRYA